ncbi:MAG: sensor histidine kinase [Gammaproteobacteria bacterium]|nr:sensor histidine kinase [Gammaproteobacteria bacterium]NIR83472.1 sensor histidine kinase [Gammaproteobacteria bacterium]NIR91394.1 sensor histidine kinase [Gammaproteobacteria bacterium]NIU04634.1 sensor histidine kinase [Gammaproteobacteria bacterium]NIV51676.1 GHKL domain-containing protein [Gammaproteobacteria bacterium]
MRSLRAGLVAGLVVSLVALFSAQWALVSYTVRSVAEGYVISRLRHDMENLLASVSRDEEGAAQIEEDPLALIYRQPFSGHYFRIETPHAVIRSRSLWDSDLSVPSFAPGQNATLHLKGPRSQSLLVLAGGFRKQDTVLTVAVAEDLSEVNEAIAAFRMQYAALSLAVMALLIAVQQWVVRRRLRPLGELRKELDRLERGEVQSLRVTVPTEVAPVVAEVNRLMGVMSARLKRSRHALGNLAHALKAPLTLLRHLADAPALAADQALRERLLTQTEAIRRLIDRELRRARFGGEAPGTRFLAEREVPDLIGTLRQMYGRDGPDIEYTISPGAVFPADREDMLELLGNLLDNACKWARTRVRLSVEEAADFTFTVEDDGPGCPPQQRSRLAQRGSRLDESREGHGLGLAVVRDIVEHYQGRLRFDESPELGGLRATVSFERRPDRDP